MVNLASKNRRNDYKAPLILAVAVHLLLIGFLVFHIPHSEPERVGLNSNVQVISAVAISSSQVSTSRPPAPHKPLPKPIQKAKPEPKLQPKSIPKEVPKPVTKTVSKPKPESKPVSKAVPKPAPKPKPVKPIVVKKPEPVKKIKPKVSKPVKKVDQSANRKKAQELQKKLLEKQLHAEQQKLKVEKQKRTAAAQALQKKLLAEQLASEQKQLKQAEVARQQALKLQGQLDQYKSQIIAAISQYWIMPPETSPNIYCQLLIRVAPSGTVLGVTMLRSSGDAVLDRSAKNAVMRASPLPVPKDPAVFDNFRELRLIFRPEGVS